MRVGTLKKAMSFLKAMALSHTCIMPMTCPVDQKVSPPAV